MKKSLLAVLMAVMMMLSFMPATYAVESEPTNVTYDLLTINWIMRERVVAVVFDAGAEIATSSLAKDTFTVHCLNNNAAGVKVNEADRNIARVYASSTPEMLDPFQRDLPAELPASGRYVIVELVFWPIAQATAASTGNDSIAFKQVYTVTQNKAFNTVGGAAIDPGDINYIQGRTINDVLDRFEYGEAQVGTNSPTKYRLFRPDDVSKRQPLVVVQHGGGQGTDNECHLRFQNNSYFAWPESQQEHPSYVLMPANCTTAAGFDNIKSVIDKMVADGLVDPDRIYITGHSMGGTATWNFVARYPKLFAAVAPLSTAFAVTLNADLLTALHDVPIWEFTTQGDSQGTGAVNMNRNYGSILGNYKYTLLPHNNILEYKGMWYSTPGDANTPGKHGAWLIAYNYYGWNDLPEAQEYPHLVDTERGRLIDWMFAQDKDEFVDPVEAKFDLLTRNWVMNERIVAVAIDMGINVDGSSLNPDTFRVYVENRNPNNNNIEAAQSLFRTVSKVYVNSAPKQTENPPESGRYVIIEMPYWNYNVGAVAGSRVASDSYKYIVNYTIYQDKNIKSAKGETYTSEDVTYVQDAVINELQDRFARVMAGTTPVRLFAPDDTSKPQPLVLLLHGSGQGSGNFDAQMSFQNNLYFAWPEIQKDYPSYVMIPAAYPTNSWDATKIDNLKALIDEMVADGRVDPDRIYITGSSMGGGGTWSFIQRYPKYFAAAAPCCAGAGGMTVESAKSLGKLPIWFFCNVNDFTYGGVMATHNNFSQYFKKYKLTLVEKNIVPELGPDYVNAPHAVWLMAYNVIDDTERGTLIEWMFAQRRVKLISATPTASVEKQIGNMNSLTIVVTEQYSDDSVETITATVQIENNAAGTFEVGDYKVYVDTQGNTKIRECYIVK